MREKVLSALISAFDNLKSKKKLPALPVPASHQVVRPKERGYGDFASNLALAVAPSMKLKPRDIATAIVQELEGDLFFEKIEVAGPGFINFFISPD
ncbi:MAG: arginine--tRNA ligase, partial [Dissulfurimicrobium sp.]